MSSFSSTLALPFGFLPYFTISLSTTSNTESGNCYSVRGVLVSPFAKPEMVGRRVERWGTPFPFDARANCTFPLASDPCFLSWMSLLLLALAGAPFGCIQQHQVFRDGRDFVCPLAKRRSWANSNNFQDSSREKDGRTSIHPLRGPLFPPHIWRLEAKRMGRTREATR